MERLKESHSATRHVVDGIDPEFRVHAESGWTVRDILGHIGAWDTQAARSLRAFGVGTEYSLADEDDEAFNQAEHQRLRQLDTRQSYAAWEDARNEFIAAIEQLPDELDTGVLRFPWRERGPLTQLIDEMIEHDVEHREELNAAIGPAG